MINVRERERERERVAVENKTEYPSTRSRII